MKEIFNKIWAEALPYQDKRHDDGHARITLKWARKLVKLEDGNEDIVIPAIILHDVGYSQIPYKRRMMIFAPDDKKEEREAVRNEHQEQSVKLGGKILKKLGYPEELVPEILEIISQHDTRKGFISKEEGLVRDADKLWRYSRESFRFRPMGNKSGVKLKLKPEGDKPGESHRSKPEDDKAGDKRKQKPEGKKSILGKRIERLEKDLEDKDYIYSESAKKLALLELEDRKRLLEKING